MPDERPALTEAAPSRLRRAWQALRRPPRLLALAAVLLLGGVVIDTRLRLSDAQAELARRLAEGAAQTKASRALAQQNQESLLALQGKVGALEAQLAEAQGQQLALEAMYQELSRSRDERLLAEIEQTVTIAAQQLQLAGNVEAALIALQGAEARLARAAQPQFLPVRKLIGRDIERLRALPTADVSGVALKLEGVIAAVDGMPLAFEQRPKAAAVPPAPTSPIQADYWRQLAAEVWAEFRQMIRIERIDHADPGLLPPQQSFFLRENLKLRLVNARLALLSHDGRSFREDLRQARDWLERYFDGRAKPVQAAAATLKTLAATDVAVGPPSLNETLAALRNFKVPKK